MLMAKPASRTRGVVNWDTDYASARWIASRKRLQPVKPLEVPITRRLQLQKLFATLDLDSGGSIDAGEILEAVALVNDSAIDLPLDGTELIERFKAMDETGEGLIKFDKFLHVMTLDLRKKEFFELQEEAGQTGSEHFSDFANLYEREMIIKEVEDKDNTNTLDKYNLFMTLFQVDVTENKSGDAEVIRLIEEKKKAEQRKRRTAQRAREAVEWLHRKERLTKPSQAAIRRDSIARVSDHYATSSPIKAAVDTLLPYSTDTPTKVGRKPAIPLALRHQALPNRLVRGTSTTSLETYSPPRRELGHAEPHPAWSQTAATNGPWTRQLGTTAMPTVSPMGPLAPRAGKMAKPKIMFGSRVMQKPRARLDRGKLTSLNRTANTRSMPALRT